MQGIYNVFVKTYKSFPKEVQMSKEFDLDLAYKINGKSDAKRVYSDWAESYEVNLVAEMGYVAPRKIADIYRENSTNDLPVLDVSAGTGLLGQQLEGLTVDAIDITPAMLEIAREKYIYRELITGDLTEKLDIDDEMYGGIVSCGTFTHGHVGPECFPELLRITKSGALFCCGTIYPVLDGLGFGSELAKLVSHRKISPVSFREIEIYDKGGHSHSEDKGIVMVFRKL